jgi:phosphatidylserine decarboxylase
MSRLTLPLKRALLFLISFPGLSRLYGRLVRVRRPRWFVRRWIRFFQRHYRVEMAEFIGKTDDYPSLADFFVRRLDPAKRPLSPVPGHIVSPCDGVLNLIETVIEDVATQVKGHTYRLSQLVGRPLDFSRTWTVATIYLSPRNYHRFHYPVAGKVERLWHSPGRLFPVNTLAVNSVRDLYLRNERIVLELRAAGQILYAVAVGATFVGSIHVECCPNSRPGKEWLAIGLPVTQLQEMGRFEMGSTIILVMPATLVDSCNVPSGAPLRLGQPLFRLRDS